jgi:hypothetical protein
METKLLIKSSAGMGDYLFCLTLSIYLKDKYNIIYIYYPEVHFNGLIDLVTRIFEENNITNIICIGNPIYKINTNNNIFSYFDDENLPVYIRNILHIFVEEITLYDEEKITYINMPALYNICNNSINFYYNIILDYYNINYYQLISSINYNLNDNEKMINNELYIKLKNKINNEKYILIFHCIERAQYVFSFRDYYSDYNKNNIKIINMCRRYNELNNNENILYIDELIGFVPMNYLHTIMENAIEIHMFDSYPLHYVSLILYNNKKLIDKINIYPRDILGYNSNENNLIIKNYKYNTKFINCTQFNIFSLVYKSHYPLLYFNNDIKKFKTFNKFLNFCAHEKYLNYINISDYNKDDHEKNLQFNINILNEMNNLKVLPSICNNNDTGLFTKTISKKINFININIDLYEKNLHDIQNFIDNILNNDNDNINKLNILLLKTSGDCVIKINPFLDQINNEIIELNTNYDKIDQLLIDILNEYIENENIHYIYPYNNQNDRNNLEVKIKKISELFFNNNEIDHQYYNY